jgi:hypothetical protein
MFDADEYYQSGNCPWAFFAYPTNLAVKHNLPPDADVRRWLGDIQARGIDVAIWVNRIADNTTYFACRKEDIQRLKDVLEEFETNGAYGEKFYSKRSEELFALSKRGTYQTDEPELE